MDVTSFLLAQADGSPSLPALLRQPAVWGAVALALGLWCLVPQGRRRRWLFAAGWVLMVVAVGLFAAQLPLLPAMSTTAVFWLLASVTVVAAVAMITARSPVYSAIWFALALLGTAGLFLMAGAQFVGIATVIVYAGAIVVMFLFLIMLAQPEGHEYYDRITWSRPATLLSTIAGAAIVLVMTTTLTRVSPPEHQRQAAEIIDLLPQITTSEEAVALPAESVVRVDITKTEANSPSVTIHLEPGASEPELIEQFELYQLVNFKVFNGELQAEQFKFVAHEPGPSATQAHVASLGTELFSRRLLSVEIAGTLLLVALVGAVAIVIRGRETESNEQPAASS